MINNELKESISLYLKYWKWFLLSMIITMIIAIIYLRYAQEEYAVAAKIQLIEDKGSSSGGMDVFQDLGMFSGGNTNVIDEINVIGSRANFFEVFEELKLNTKIYSEGRIRDTELYSKPPLKFTFIGEDSLMFKKDLTIYLNIKSGTDFTYTFDEDLPNKKSSFGKTIKSEVGDIVVTPNEEIFKSYIGKPLRIEIVPSELLYLSYNSKVSITPDSENSEIINFSLKDPVQEKGRNILNKLIEVYNRNGIEEKKTIADKTSNFINDRITKIGEELSGVDETAENFKSERGLTDISSEANINLNIGAANQQELMNANTQYQIASSMKDLVDTQNGYEVLPSNLGLSDPSIASTTAKYNELVLERNRLLKSSTEKSPIIQNLDQELSSLKTSMKSSLSSVTNNLGLQVNSLSNQRSKINSKIYSAPKNERLLRDITRQQQTSEALYLYLLQKREEAQITFASSEPNSKVIDAAYNNGIFPVSPKNKIIYLASLIIGFIIPFSFIYLKDLLDNKISNKTSLEGILKNTPVLAELPKLSKKNSKMVLKDDRSVLAESLRILRTNLDYLMKSKKTPGKNNIIYVTSSVSGEGKTFLSSNLSMILSNTGKKVLLIGADIRNPKIYSFFDDKNSKIDSLNKTNQRGELGLTEYLYDKNISTSDIVKPLLVHDNTIDVIYSGKIPPNPAELLMSERLKELMGEVSETYDYVIVDTAPLMVVSDTLTISQYADHIIYVTRAGVTEIDVINFPMKLQEEGKLHNLSFVVNDVKESNLGYGGKYGYGYGKTMKKWWKF
ncbi:polysaccharide biosynthesis tyrosine autokinase [Cellulophaga baltica]|uniref:GumC family protein n=1 Tax=Cellulophaga TaxID=104264 RepID=UPI001C06FEF2|nr:MULTISPECIES: polysaccharide biosynthesis tyrosine autokinase [Cellulophaga]MBU2996755.1 polysaccharide biosynthesis tyrosine autokinase [Cellulophaga baltica]MDO6768151.1 polysaccharide biosynthesis tyrosine autokinase [Cellulophaga sp. 1_MG-2023]